MASQKNTSDLIHSIVSSRVTILQQLHARGYDIDKYNHFNINEINTLNQNGQLSMMMSKPSTDAESEEVTEKTFVHYYLHKNLRFKDLTNIIADVFDGEDPQLTKKDTLIIILNEEKIESIISDLKQIWEQDGRFIIIKDLRSLKFNVLRHVLVPEHVIMTEEETELVKTRNHITHDFQWPSLSRFDPVAEAIGIRPDQVCRINRPSTNAIIAPYYRMCVNKSIEKKKLNSSKE